MLKLTQYMADDGFVPDYDYLSPLKNQDLLDVNFSKTIEKKILKEDLTDDDT
jgi:hypothetical protein